MDLEMKYVYAVYQENSFSQAAEKLFISQSAISSMVRKAEKELGCQIFDRSTIPFTLTPEGRFYIEQVEKIMRIEENIRMYFDDRKNMKTGYLKVGSSSFYSAYFLTNIMKSFQKRYPGIKVELKEGDGKELKDFLLDGSIDFLFGTLPEAYFDKQTQNVFFAYEYLILVVPEHYSVNEKLKRYQIPIDNILDNSFLEKRFPPIPLYELKDCPFVSLTKSGSELYHRTINICRNAGFVPNITQQLSQIMTAYFVAAAGEGVTLVRSSLFSVIKEKKGLIYYKIGDALAKRPIYITYSKERYMSRAMSAFLDFTAALPLRYHI